MTEAFEIEWSVTAESSTAQWRIGVERIAEIHGDQNFMRAAVVWTHTIPNVWRVVFDVDLSASPCRDEIEPFVDPESGRLGYIVSVNESDVSFSVPEELTTRLVLQWRRMMRALGEVLGLPEPPLIEMNPAERSFISQAGVPTVPGGKLRVRRAPDRAVSRERLFNILAPTADPLENLAGMVDRLAILSDDERAAVALRVSREVARWQLKLATLVGGCATDSEVLHAMSLLLGGERSWNAALRNPLRFLHVYPVDPAEAERVAMLLR